jgi:hypothetical protein
VRQNGSTPTPDVPIIFEDVEEFVDPIMVVGDRGDLDPNVWQVHGIQVHVCPKAEVGVVYVVDRPKIVDEEGLCLVCGRDTYA